MSALAGTAKTLTPAQRRRLARQIPGALQTFAAAQVAAIEATLYSEFSAWAAGGGMSADWGLQYAAATTARAEALFTTAASLTVDYTAMVTTVELPLAGWGADDAARIATANWRWTPITILGDAMKAGIARPQAIDQAARQAAGLGSLDVSTQERNAVSRTQETSNGLITGQRKEPGGGACGWCLVVASQAYSKDAQVPSHRNDRCGVVPIVRGDETRDILADRRASYGDWQDATKVQAIPTDDLIAYGAPTDPYAKIQPHAD